MKVNKYIQPGISENHVDIYYEKLDAATNAVLNFVDTLNNGIQGKREDEIKIIYPYEIYYFEMVDRRCFVYLKDSVWKVELTLKDLIEKFYDNGFVRISKSMIVNVYKIDKLKPSLNMRVNIVMDNGEVLILNRGYKKEFYSYLSNLKGSRVKDEINK